MSQRWRRYWRTQKIALCLAAPVVAIALYEGDWGVSFGVALGLSLSWIDAP